MPQSVWLMCEEVGTVRGGLLGTVITVLVIVLLVILILRLI